ncbi:hypothetical protein BC567DRAFT_212010 [Phyllosticta citribraziliensis]
MEPASLLGHLLPLRNGCRPAVAQCPRPPATRAKKSNDTGKPLHSVEETIDKLGTLDRGQANCQAYEAKIHRDKHYCTWASYRGSAVDATSNNISTIDSQPKDSTLHQTKTKRGARDVVDASNRHSPRLDDERQILDLR